MKTTKTGDLAEAKFKVLCLENNINVLEPIGNNSPYDVVLDINGRFLRIQIKQGWINKKDSRVIFANGKSSTTNRSSKTTRYYTSESIDYFAILCPVNNSFYMLHVNEATRGTIQLNIVPKSYKTSKNAEDFTFDIFLESMRG